MEVVGETGAETGAGTGGEALGDAAADALVDAAAAGRRPLVRGHVVALVTVLVWAVTFVSTKVLLVHLAPIEILFFRFMIGFAALALLRPRILRVRGFKEERWFMLAGATGVTLYYLLENIALTFTTASIVGVVVAAAPLFTGIASAVVLKERLRAPFFAGFAVAMAGVCLVSFSGGAAGLTGEGGLGQHRARGRGAGAGRGGHVGRVLHRDEEALDVRLRQHPRHAPHVRLGPRFHASDAARFGLLARLGLARRARDVGQPRVLGPGGQRAVLRDVEHGGEGAGAREDEPVHLPRARAHRAGLGGRAGRSAHAARHRRRGPDHRGSVPVRAGEVATRRQRDHPFQHEGAVAHGKDERAAIEAKGRPGNWAAPCNASSRPVLVGQGASRRDATERRALADVAGSLISGVSPTPIRTRRRCTRWGMGSPKGSSTSARGPRTGPPSVLSMAGTQTIA